MLIYSYQFNMFFIMIGMCGICLLFNILYNYTHPLFFYVCIIMILPNLEIVKFGVGLLLY